MKREAFRIQDAFYVLAVFAIVYTIIDIYFKLKAALT